MKPKDLKANNKAAAAAAAASTEKYEPDDCDYVVHVMNIPQWSRTFDYMMLFIP